MGRFYKGSQTQLSAPCDTQQMAISESFFSPSASTCITPKTHLPKNHVGVTFTSEFTSPTPTLQRKTISLNSYPGTLTPEANKGSIQNTSIYVNCVKNWVTNTSKDQMGFNSFNSLLSAKLKEKLIKLWADTLKKMILFLACNLEEVQGIELHCCDKMSLIMNYTFYYIYF